MPVTIPVLPTLATVVSPLAQLPPDAASVKVVVFPAHTDEAPVMVPALGKGFIVMP